MGEFDASKMPSKIQKRLGKLHGWFRAVQAKIRIWKTALVRINTPKAEDPLQFEPERKELIQKVAQIENLVERSLFKFESLKIKEEDFRAEKAMSQVGSMPANRARYVTVPLSKLPSTPKEDFQLPPERKF